MATGDSRTFFADKRQLPQQRIKESFFDYLADKLDGLARRTFGSKRGVFGAATLVSAGNDKFSVTTLPIEFLDGNGAIINLAGADGTAIQFENTSAILYDIGLREIQVPAGVQRNPRTGVIHYDRDVDSIGELGDPDSVAEVAGTLELIVDAIFEPGVSHASRLVTVFLKAPRSTVEPVAIERNLTVQFVGGQNKVITSGLLGQQAGSASTNPADYHVVAQGVTVRRNTNLEITLPYAFIGRVTGGGPGNPPSGFSTVGQIDVSAGLFPDLQTAYTQGRTITPSGAEGGAVKIASADSGDALKSLLHLDRRGATEPSPIDLANVAEESGGANVLNLVPLRNTNGALNLTEPADTNTGAAGRLDFTRGAFSLSTNGVDPTADLVLLSGFPTASVNGLYLIGSVIGPTQVDLVELDGSAPASWPGASESGNAEFLRARLGVSQKTFANSLQGIAGVVLQGMIDGSIEAPEVLKMFPRGVTEDIVKWFNNFATPALRARLTKHCVLDLKTSGIIPDGKNTQLHLDRLGNTDWMQFGLRITTGDVSGVPIAVFSPVNFVDLLQTEAVDQTGTRTLTFTRVGVDLTSQPVRLDKRMHLVLLTGSPTESENGLYAIDAFTATTIDVTALQTGAAPASWTTGSGRTATVLVPRFVFSNSNPTAGGVDLSFLDGPVITAAGGQGFLAPIKIIPNTDNSPGLSMIQLFNSDFDTFGGAPAPKVYGSFSDDGLLALGAEVGGQVPGGLQLITHPHHDPAKYGLNVRPATLVQLDGDLPSNRHMGLFAEPLAAQKEFMRWTGWGRLASTHRWQEGFHVGSDPESLFSTGVGSTGYGGAISTRNNQGGIAEVESGASVNDERSLFGIPNWTIRDFGGGASRIIYLYGRIRIVTSLANVVVFCGIEWASGTEVGVEYNAAGGPNWQVVTRDGASANFSLGVPAVLGTDDPTSGWLEFWLKLDIASNLVSSHLTGQSIIDAQNFPNSGSANWNDDGAFRFRCKTTTTAAKRAQIDHVEIWDEIMLAGPAG